MARFVSASILLALVLAADPALASSAQRRNLRKTGPESKKDDDGKKDEEDGVVIDLPSRDEDSKDKKGPSARTIARDPDSEDSGAPPPEISSKEVSNFNDGNDGAKCDLRCDHGGYCSFRGVDADEMSAQARSGNLIEMCVCPLGFVGLACDEVVDQCQYPSRMCHNGMPCTKDSQGQYTCDCAVADAISSFAGRMYRNSITEYCGNTRYKFKAADMPESFCTNGGRCKEDFVSPSDSYTISVLAPNQDEVGQIFADESHQDEAKLPFQHRGCVCPPEFYGPHCKFIRLPGVTMNVGGSTEEPKSMGATLMWSSTVVAIVAFTTCVGSLILLRYRQQRRRLHWASRMQDHDKFNTYDIRNAPTTLAQTPVCWLGPSGRPPWR